MSELCARPGPDMQNSDTGLTSWSEDPRGPEAPKRKIGTDPKVILVHDQG